jgi:hypothetical protein
LQKGALSLERKFFATETSKSNIQWGDNQFRFLEVPEKTPILIFFSKNLPPLKSAALGGRLVRLMVKPPPAKACLFFTPKHSIDVAIYTVLPLNQI